VRNVPPIYSAKDDAEEEVSANEANCQVPQHNTTQHNTAQHPTNCKLSVLLSLFCGEIEKQGG